MKRELLITFMLFLAFISNSSDVDAIPYHIVNTIDMNGYDLVGLTSDESNLIGLYNGQPDKVGIFTTSGVHIRSFDIFDAFSSGITYNGQEIVFNYKASGSHSGQLYEMDPNNGSISGPVGSTDYMQASLSFDGNNILASGQANGSDGILDIPIWLYDSSTYEKNGDFTVTIDTGTSISGISRTGIAWHNDHLFVALNLDTIFEFDKDLNFVQEIYDPQIPPIRSIANITFIGEDLFAYDRGAQLIYQYSPGAGPGPGPDPIPEPSTILLLGSGLIGLVGWGRKKFKKR